MRRLLLLLSFLFLISLIPAQCAASDGASLEAARRLMLQLLNDARAEAGLDSVSLSAHPAAQQHADAMLADCFTSHWDVAGAKPYMRYSQAGGYQANAENVHSSYAVYQRTADCALSGTEITPDLNDLVRSAVASLLDSPGHRRTILTPSYRLVSIGLSWRANELGEYHFRAVQHFEGDYTRLDELPVLENGVFRLRGRAVNGADLSDTNALYLRFDPLPTPLTADLLNDSRSYCGGLPIGAVFPTDRWTARMSAPDCAPPGGALPAQAGALIEVPTIAADLWDLDGGRFEIEANLTDLLRQHGAGVYTFTLTGDVDGDPQTILLQYALFYDSQLPADAAAYLAQHRLRGVFLWDPALQQWSLYAEQDGRAVPGSVNRRLTSDLLIVPIE